MALTTDELRIPETTAPEQARPPTPPRRRSIIFGWAAVVGAVVAAGLLAALVLTPDRGPSTVDTGRTIIEHGSVAAIDHRDQQAVAPRTEMTRTVAEHGSVAAIDHRDQQALASAPR
jgi:hypothetical protein